MSKIAMLGCILVSLVCAPSLMALDVSVSLLADGQSQVAVPAGGTLEAVIMLQADAPMIAAQSMLSGNGQYFSTQGTVWAEGWTMLIDLPAGSKPLPSDDMVALAADFSTGRNSGPFVTVTIKVDAATPPGSYEIKPLDPIVGSMDFEPGTISAINALTLHVVPGPSAPSLVSAISQKSHGSAGAFAIDVSNPAAVEPRTGGPTLVVATFSDPVQAADASAVVASSGSVSSVTASDNDLSITLSGATDAAPLTLTFPGVTGVNGGPAVTDSLCFKVLAGDTDQDGTASALDVIGVRNSTGQTANPSNFIWDVNADGEVTIADIVLIRNNLNKTAADCQ